MDLVSGPSTRLLVRHRQRPTATSGAAQLARVRASARRPSRFTNAPTQTLSTKSRFTAERSGIGSEPGSRPTSLARPPMVVVHGATSARRSRGIAASRDSTPADAGRSRPSHTTTALRVPKVRSRFSRRSPPRRKVAPLVGLIKRVLAVGYITRIHLGRSMAST